MPEYDVVILGAGPGGYVAAIRGARLGQSVCLIEKDELGGTCLNKGCIPTKALISCVEAYEFSKKLDKFGVKVENVFLDIQKMMEKKNKTVERLRKGVDYLLKRGKVDIVKGIGKFIAPGIIDVDCNDGISRIKAPKTIIATGSTPLTFPSFGYNGKTIITSDEALDCQEVPQSILIVGGGVIGCELAFIFAGLGSKVTVVDIMPTILPMEDPDISAIINTSFRKSGVTVKCGIKIEKIIESHGKAVAYLESGEQLVADKVLLSVGRKPNSQGIGLSKIGIKVNDRGEILVNNKMETNIPGIYGIGDVVGNIMLAHVASFEGLIAIHNVAGENRSMNYNSVPSAIFTKPEVASVGINETQGKELGIKMGIGKFPFRASGKALIMDETDGFVKVIIDSKTKIIVGVHIAGPNATELIAGPTLAVKNRMTVQEFTNTIHAHPTLSESLIEAVEAVQGKAIHM